MRAAGLVLLFTIFLSSPAWAEEKKGHLEAGVEAYNTGDYDAAIENFQKAFVENPEDPAQIYNLLGLAYFKQDKSIKSAIGSFEEALKINPKYAEAYFNLATAYAGPAADPSLAAEYFQKTIEVDPHYSKAYFGLGWFTLTEKHDPAKSAEYFKKTLELFPDFAEAHYALGLAEIQMGEAPLALASVSQLRTLNRQDLAALLEATLRHEEPNPSPDSSGKTAESKAASPGGSSKPSHPMAGSSPVEISLKGKVIPMDSEPVQKTK